MNVAKPLATETHITPQQELILDFVSKNGQITEVEIMELLDVKKTRAYTVAKQMREEKLLAVVGRGANKKYIVQN